MTAQKLADAYKAAEQFLDDVEGLEIVEKGEWTQDHKYQSCETIVSFEGSLYAVQQSRSGSYHSDWHYDTTYFVPVERHEETKVVVSYKENGARAEVAPHW